MLGKRSTLMNFSHSGQKLYMIPSGFISLPTLGLDKCFKSSEKNCFTDRLTYRCQHGVEINGSSYFISDRFVGAIGYFITVMVHCTVVEKWFLPRHFCAE